MKPLIVYHANCADGFGAAYAAWAHYGSDATYLPAQYGEGSYLKVLQQESVTDREVHVLDFSFPKQDMIHLLSVASKVVWLDHHKTAFEMNLDLPYPHQCILDNDRSGALIAWEYYNPKSTVPMCIRYLDDYDRWQFKLPDTKAVSKALWSYTPWTFAQWATQMEGHTEQLAAEGWAILRAHVVNVNAVVKGAARLCHILHIAKTGPEHWQATFDVDAKGLSANCPPHLSSDVGHELANQSGTFGLLWHINKDGKVLCSLRSNGDYDVSAIAKAFGGGGHKNAAGFETDVPTIMGMLK